MTAPDLSCELAGIKLASFLMNASGPKCTTLKELEAVGQSQSAVIVTKSCTMLPRNGNPEPRYKNLALGAIQSMGLPNLGYQAYLEMIPQLKTFNKPLMVSVSGFSLEENQVMIAAFMQSAVDLIEVNFSCPNIAGKPQLAYDFEQVKHSLEKLSRMGDKPLGIKLSPYFDISHFETMAAIISQYPIHFITCINSVGNTLVIDPENETPVIKPKGGFGGLCGDYIKPIGLANVRAFKQLLPDSIQVIGVGGIKSGSDAFEYLLAGADAVQIATCVEKEGVDCFTRIEEELSVFMVRKGYHCLAQARSKLQ